MERPCHWRKAFHLIWVDMRLGVIGWFWVAFMLGCVDQDAAPVNQEIAFLLNDSTQAVFPIILKNSVFELQNGGEVMSLNPINDTTYLVPVFGGSWVVHPDKSLGIWTDSLRSSDYHVDFQFQPKTPRNNRGELPNGTWDIWFGEKGADQQAEGQLDLKIEEGVLRGTIRTPTGDYRFFSGSFTDGSLHMQTYDGAHLYCIQALLRDNQWVDGHFYSGNHYHTTWSAVSAAPWITDDVVQIVEVTQNDLRFNSFNVQGELQPVSLVPDSNQVVVVDLLGTWCPNCMDEVRLLREIKDNHPHVRIVSVAYERDTLPSDVFRRLAFYAAQLDIDWEVYWGGRASKSVAAATFPFLDEVISFPTTLFIYPNGTIAIHSGFNGPATGSAYEAEHERFTHLVHTGLSFQIDP